METSEKKQKGEEGMNYSSTAATRPAGHERTFCSRQAVLDQLRSSGYRITKQRELLLDILLEGSCSSGKEIYAVAKSRDSSIGFATVYRFLNTLEDIGVISRCNMFRMISAPGNK